MLCSSAFYIITPRSEFLWLMPTNCTIYIILEKNHDERIKNGICWANIHNIGQIKKRPFAWWEITGIPHAPSEVEKPSSSTYGSARPPHTASVIPSCHSALCLATVNKNASSIAFPKRNCHKALYKTKLQRTQKNKKPNNNFKINSKWTSTKHDFTRPSFPDAWGKKVSFKLPFKTLNSLQIAMTEEDHSTAFGQQLKMPDHRVFLVSSVEHKWDLDQWTLKYRIKCYNVRHGDASGRDNMSKLVDPARELNREKLSEKALQPCQGFMTIFYETGKPNNIFQMSVPGA